MFCFDLVLIYNISWVKCPFKNFICEIISNLLDLNYQEYDTLFFVLYSKTGVFLRINPANSAVLMKLYTSV